MTGSFTGWSNKDILSEVRECRECICSTETTDREKTSALNVIALASITYELPEQDLICIQAIFEECQKRIDVVVNNISPSVVIKAKKLDDYNPNACKTCGLDDAYSSVAGHIICENCGTDFDEPSPRYRMTKRGFERI